MSDIFEIKKIEGRLRLISYLNYLVATAMAVVLFFSILYFVSNLSSDIEHLQSLTLRMAGWAAMILGLISFQGKSADFFISVYKKFAENYGLRNKQARSTKNIVKLYRNFLNRGGPFFQGIELHAGIFSLTIAVTGIFLISFGLLWISLWYANTF